MSEHTVPEQIPLSRERRTELLAYAGSAELMELADTCLGAGEDPVVVVAPELGTITAQVREPIVGQRFLLGDVLVCRAEVQWSGYRGWAMRTDENRPAALAAAILDAAQADPVHAEQVDALCARVTERTRDDEAAEWAELEPTIVRFEELR